MLGVAQALAEVVGRSITLAELMPAGGSVQFADGRVVDASVLRSVLSGGAVPRPAVPEISSITDPRLEPGWGKADDRLVAELGVAPEALRAVTRGLYGHSATRERDQRAGDGASPQKLGRATREILSEVAAEVAAE